MASRENERARMIVGIIVARSKANVKTAII